MKTQRYHGQAGDRLPAIDCSIHTGFNFIPFYGDNKAVTGALDGTTKAHVLRSITWGTSPVEGAQKASIANLRDSLTLNNIMPAYICDAENSIDVLTKPKDSPTFHAHSKIIRGHADLEFEKTIQILEKDHQSNTTKKPYKFKTNYDKISIKLPKSFVETDHEV